MNDNEYKVIAHDMERVIDACIRLIVDCATNDALKHSQSFSWLHTRKKQDAL